MDQSKKKMLSRDVRRRLQVIENKIQDLHHMGVPCVFVYATTWTGGLYLIGDEKMANPIKANSGAILGQLKEAPLPDTAAPLASNFCLPRLPAKLPTLNNKTLTSMLVGLGKDLQIKWKREPPVWWPEEIHFQHPRNAAPEQFKGNCELLQV